MPSHPAAEPKLAQPIRILVADRNRMYSQLLAESLGPDPRFEVLAVAGAAEIFAVAAREPNVSLSASFGPDRLGGMWPAPKHGALFA